jgi:hypothetical protein
LVVGAPGTSSSTTANAGHLYTFHGQAAAGGVIPLSSADEVVAGTASGVFLGTVVANLGPVIGSLPNLGVGNPVDGVDYPGGSGVGFVFSGSSPTGPLLQNKDIVVLSNGVESGPVILGGGLSGLDTALSLVGSSKPDLLMTAEFGPFFTITDGTNVPVPPASVDAATTADVKVSLPSGWSIGPNGGSLIPDVNGDGFTDFAIRNAVTSGVSQVAIYY